MVEVGLESLPRAPDDVRSRASAAYELSQAIVANKKAMSRLGDRLSKIKKLPDADRLDPDLMEAFIILDSWLSKNLHGYAGGSDQIQLSEMKAHLSAGPKGRNGNGALFSASSVLLNWWQAGGRQVTSTLYGQSVSAEGDEARADGTYHRTSDAVGSEFGSYGEWSSLQRRSRTKAANSLASSWSA